MLSWIDTAGALTAISLLIWAIKKLIQSDQPIESKLYDPSKTQAALQSTRKKKPSPNQQSTLNTPTTQFPLMNLPPELRLKIWKLCLPGPRLIHASDDHSSSPNWKFTTTPTPSPILLQINYESRSLTLETYLPIFKPSKPLGYFNPSIDIIFFAPGSRLYSTDFMKYKIFQNMRQLAVITDLHLLGLSTASLVDNQYGWCLFRKLVVCGGLERLLVVFGRYDDVLGDCERRGGRLERFEGEGEVGCGGLGRGDDMKVLDAVEGFRGALGGFKVLKGLDSVPEVVPVRCVV